MIDPQQIDLDYDPDSFAGPLDLERVRQNEWTRTVNFPWMVYDPSYVKHLQAYHGGSLANGCFRTCRGNTYRLGRFVNFATKEALPPPFQPSIVEPRYDARLDWSIGYLEAIANIADGMGAFLVPFGILYCGPHHPDDMDPTHSNFVCFDYTDMYAPRPKVVVWFNDLAVDECFRCEDEEMDLDLGDEDMDPFLDMDTSRFTEEVALNFDEFLTFLKPVDESTDAEIILDPIDEPEILEGKREREDRIRPGQITLNREFIEYLKQLQHEASRTQSLRLDDGREISIERYLHFDRDRRQEPDNVLEVWKGLHEQFGSSMIPFIEIDPVENYICMDHRTDKPRIAICWTQGQMPPIELVAENFNEFLSRVHNSTKSR